MKISIGQLLRFSDDKMRDILSGSTYNCLYLMLDEVNMVCKDIPFQNYYELMDFFVRQAKELRINKDFWNKYDLDKIYLEV